ncbi:hypothetical protein CDL15_Pgr016822 [Punica granatum]|uniref:Uncharacterized protein n=1 Tax=Punica granatum TaxID=22663 RepID=A0A218WX31_PUNGR|nr:hypothetical protein CDL15_Pgr016822 [Punica granatum]PKI38370.1 hypothetical protein CRG98_041240 [Punica granatum]
MLISVFQDQSELHLYYEHDHIDNLIELIEEEIKELEKIEAQRKESEAAQKKKQEEFQMREQEVAHAREQERAKGMASECFTDDDIGEALEVTDLDEEDDDIHPEQSIEIGASRVDNANVGEVRVRNKIACCDTQEEENVWKEEED